MVRFKSLMNLNLKLSSVASFVYLLIATLLSVHKKILWIFFMTSLSPKTFVFLHTAKSGGSSFWHALAFQASKSTDPKIHVLGTHNTSITLYGAPNRQRDAAVHLLSSFSKNKGNLLLHYHGPGEDLDTVFPPELAPTYILLQRDPFKRMVSAFKWYMITELKKSYTDDSVELQNFFNVFLSSGYDKILPTVFGCSSFSKSWLDEIRSRLLVVSLEDFNSKGKDLQKLCSIMNIGILDPFVYKETVTSGRDISPTLPPDGNLDFWDQFHARVASEYLMRNMLLFH